MGISPIPALTWIVLFAAWTAYLLYGNTAPAALELPTCDDLFDIITGCDSILSEFIALVAVGTVPGLPIEWNLVFLTIGLVARLQVGWAIAEWARGV